MRPKRSTATLYGLNTEYSRTEKLDRNERVISFDVPADLLNQYKEDLNSNSGRLNNENYFLNFNEHLATSAANHIDDDEDLY